MRTSCQPSSAADVRSTLKSLETLLRGLYSTHIIQLIILVVSSSPAIANYIAFKFNLVENNVKFSKVHYSSMETLMRHYFKIS